jgi:hypothetical protein
MSCTDGSSVTDRPFLTAVPDTSNPYAPHGIRINAVCPGTIETPMVAAMVVEDSQRREPLEVARLFPLTRWLIFDRALGGRIDLFRGQQHDCPYARAARLANGKRERGGTLVVRKISDSEGVTVAEGEVEMLESSPHALGGSGYGFASIASALPSEALDALHRVRRFKQESRHQAPF